MDPIKCTVLVDKKATPETMGELKIEIEHVGGDLVSSNEIEDLVDIGRDDRWKYKYGMDGESIDTFSWSLNNISNDFGNAKYLARACAVTFRTIGLLIDKKYRKNRSGGHSHFRDEFTHDLSVFDDRPSVLAQAYLFMPNMGKQWKGLTQWNDNYFLTPYGDSLEAYLIDPVNYTEGEKDLNGDLKLLSSMPFLHINMHEKKHAHGYWHDLNSPESIMYPYAKKGYKLINDPVTGKLMRDLNKSAFIWTPDDIKRWHEGYPARRGVSGWLGRMRARRLRGRRYPGVPYLVAV